MSSVKHVVAKKLEQENLDRASVSVSFRCPFEASIKMDLAVKYLGYSSRSKFLSDIVPAALSDAISLIPKEYHADFCKELEKKLLKLMK